MILTIDLGSSATKAALWDDSGLVALEREPLPTRHPRPGWAEQDPGDWWDSVVSVCRRLDARDRATVEAVGFSAARETFVPVSASGECLGPGIVWSDRRAAAEARRLARSLGGAEAARQRTGVVLGANSPVAKASWLSEHEPDRLEASRWLLAPRDLVVMRATGEVMTDWTLASRTGFLDTGGMQLPELAGLADGRLPEVHSSSHVAGGVTPGASRELGLAPGTPVVLGAGDRACEALGAGCTPSEPVVSWGTTASLALPVAEAPGSIPRGLAMSRGALKGRVLEGGLSASGQAMSWLARVTGRDVAGLAKEAAGVEAGSGGVLALPWLNGARAPWWDDRASAAFVGLGAASGPGELARAVFEGVAADIARCLEAAAQVVARPTALRAAGGAADASAWLGALSGMTALPVLSLQTPEAASAGACMIAAFATGGSRATRAADALNPVTGRRDPDLGAVRAYRELRPAMDAAARAVLGLAPGGEGR
jgi:xylulokinase